MKYLKQFSIIMGITLLGELIHHLVPLNVPASVYGIVILFICLETKLLKLDSVKETGKFLIDIMSILFLPASVGVIAVWGIVKDRIVIYALITFVTTVTVMAASGLVTQFIAEKKSNGGKNNE